VSTIQGNFLSKEIQAEIKQFLEDPHRGRPRQQLYVDEAQGLFPKTPDISDTSESYTAQKYNPGDRQDGSTKDRDERPDHEPGKTIDIVLSDMSAPWEQTSGFWKRSLSNPYIRMMNTSGIPFRDHTGSMV
jgi:21S rRNA (uridine2791-2'-O)-methyltransferase